MKFVQATQWLAVIFLLVAGTRGDDSKIVSGWDARVGQFPSMAHLQIDGNFACAAVVIADIAALTAESCIKNRVYNQEKWKLVAGTNARSPTDEPSGFVFGMRGPPIQHPSYDDCTGQNNIAMLSLKLEIEHPGSTSVIPAYIMQGMTVNLYDTVTIAGWGHTHAGSGLSEQLRYMKTTFLSREHCNAMYYDGLLSSDMTCTGNEYAVTDICPGDMGGPLYVGDGESNELIGIAVRESQCSADGAPGVFIDLRNEDVYKFIYWNCLDCGLAAPIA